MMYVKVAGLLLDDTYAEEWIPADGTPGRYFFKTVSTDEKSRAMMKLEAIRDKRRIILAPSQPR